MLLAAVVCECVAGLGLLARLPVSYNVKWSLEDRDTDTYRLIKAWRWLKCFCTLCDCSCA